MLTDFNETLCLEKENGIFDIEILNNNATLILDTKYKKADIAKLAADQKIPPSQCHDLHNALSKYNTSLIGHWTSIHTKWSMLTYFLACKWFTTMYTCSLEFMRPH